MSELIDEERTDCCNIIRTLKSLKNTMVNIRVLGDWMFTGRVTKVENCMVILTEVVVVSSGGLTINSFELANLTINTESITSIGKPNA